MTFRQIGAGWLLAGIVVVGIHAGPIPELCSPVVLALVVVSTALGGADGTLPRRGRS